jgi:hypothetical protein
VIFTVKVTWSVVSALAEQTNAIASSTAAGKYFIINSDFRIVPALSGRPYRRRAETP